MSRSKTKKSFPTRFMTFSIFSMKQRPMSIYRKPNKIWLIKYFSLNKKGIFILISADFNF